MPSLTTTNTIFAAALRTSTRYSARTTTTSTTAFPRILAVGRPSRTMSSSTDTGSESPCPCEPCSDCNDHLARGACSYRSTASLVLRSNST